MVAQIDKLRNHIEHFDVLRRVFPGVLSAPEGGRGKTGAAMRPRAAKSKWSDGLRSGPFAEGGRGLHCWFAFVTQGLSPTRVL